VVYQFFVSPPNLSFKGTIKLVFFGETSLLSSPESIANGKYAQKLRASLGVMQIVKDFEKTSNYII
jgi:hypothetical protein